MLELGQVPAKHGRITVMTPLMLRVCRRCYELPSLPGCVAIWHSCNTFASLLPPGHMRLNAKLVLFEESRALVFYWICFLHQYMLICSIMPLCFKSRYNCHICSLFVVVTVFYISYNSFVDQQYALAESVDDQTIQMLEKMSPKRELLLVFSRKNQLKLILRN